MFLDVPVTFITESFGLSGFMAIVYRAFFILLIYYSLLFLLKLVGLTDNYLGRLI
jgi:type IV secretory pathway VirB3-like protein